MEHPRLVFAGELARTSIQFIRAVDFEGFVATQC
jgi:hypothetical protein